MRILGQGSRRLPGQAAFVALVGALLLGACAPEDRPRERVDLAERFALSTIETATRAIDFGDPAARAALTSGWFFRDQRPADSEPFAWGVGKRSTVRFEVFDPSDLELSLRCRGIRRAGLSPQRVTFDVNGTEVGTVELTPGIGEYRLLVPEEIVRLGRNELGLGYEFHRVLGEGERQALAVAWYEIRFGTGEGSGSPRLDDDRGIVFVPFDSAVHFPVLSTADSELEIGSWSRRGDGVGELEIRIETDEIEGRTLAVIDGESDSPERWALGVEGPARLSLISRAADRTALGAFALDGLEISRPARAEPLPSPARAQAGDDEIGDAIDEGRRPNVVVYLVDTLRSDRLGVYGHSPSLSPRLDDFAQDGVVFERAVAQSSWTRSAVASLLTGLWPGGHGTIGRRDRLPDEAETLGELLSAEGYETVAVLTNPNVSGNFGFRQGFEHYFHLAKQTDSVRVNERVRQWVESYDGERPFFLYVHTADPHTPYLPPEPYRSRVAADADAVFEIIEARPQKQIWEPEAETIRQLYALYDAEIAFNDDSFGVFLDLLRERGLYENSFIAFVSDHGEEFYEHGAWTHGKNLFGDTLHVPFVARFPGGPAGRRVASRVQQVDLVPTVLDLIGVEIPTGLDGASLLPIVSAGEPESAALQAQDRLEQWGERPAFSHLRLDGPLYLGVEEAGYKLMQRIDGTDVQTRLYDMANDPTEQNELSAELPITRDYLVFRLKEKTRQGGSLHAEQALVDEELARELRALGYVP